MRGKITIFIDAVEYSTFWLQLGSNIKKKKVWVQLGDQRDQLVIAQTAVLLEGRKVICGLISRTWRKTHVLRMHTEWVAGVTLEKSP